MTQKIIYPTEIASVGEGTISIPGSSVPPFDPSTLAATTWQQGAFPGPIPPGGPWAGSVSAGPSGNREMRTFNGTVDVGGSLNGISSASYDNTMSAQMCGLQYYANGGGPALDVTDVVDSTAGKNYTVMGLSRFLSADPATALPYQNRTLIAGNARWGVYGNSTKIGVWHFTGAFPFVEEAAAAVNTVFFWCVRWGGIIGANTAQVDINDTSGTPTALAATTVLAGVGCLTSNDTFNTAGGQFETWDQMTIQSAISDADRDGYKSYLRARYGNPF